MERFVSKIFEERPYQWGLRGDPFLWDDLEKCFSDTLVPCSEEDFLKRMHSAFEELTGVAIDSEQNIHIPQYSHGGMSSGMVCPEFWVSTALPLLLNRLQKLNEGK